MAQFENINYSKRTEEEEANWVDRTRRPEQESFRKGKKEEKTRRLCPLSPPPPFLARKEPRIFPRLSPSPHCSQDLTESLSRRRRGDRRGGPEMCSASDSSPPPPFVPRTIRHFLTEIADVGDGSSRLDDFVERLEGELDKIDAFKRELPLCMLLLSEAIEALKNGSMRPSAPSARPVLEQFIPLENDAGGSEGVGEKPKDERRCTTSSPKLVDTAENSSSSSSFDLNENPKAELQTEIVEEQKLAACEDQSQFRTCESRNADARQSHPLFPSAMASGELAEIPLHGFLSLGVGIKNPSEESSSSTGTVSGRSRTISSVDCNAPSSSRGGNQQTAKKRRRSWSPELHQRFLDALQQLGGPQVATPKQIRELMQVDGLTNDEVKSHLQKYRLHNQRHPIKAFRSQKSGIQTVLQMATDISGDSLKMTGPQSPSPQSSFHIAGNPGLTSHTASDSMEEDREPRDP